MHQQHVIPPRPQHDHDPRQESTIGALGFTTGFDGIIGLAIDFPLTSSVH